MTYQQLLQIIQTLDKDQLNREVIVYDSSTDGYYTTVSFFLEEPNYDLVDSWELDTAKLELLEGN